MGVATLKAVNINKRTNEGKE